MPSGGDVDAALVGDLGVLTETAAKEGMVSVAVEALYGHEREARGGGEGHLVEGGHGMVVVGGGLATHREPSGGIGVREAEIVKMAAAWGMAAEEGMGVGCQGAVESGVEGGESHVQGSVVEGGMGTGERLTGVVLAVYLALGAVVACAEQGGDGGGVGIEGGVDGTVGGKGGEVDMP